MEQGVQTGCGRKRDPGGLPNRENRTGKRNESLQVAKNNGTRNKSMINLENGRVNNELCVGNF